MFKYLSVALGILVVSESKSVSLRNDGSIMLPNYEVKGQFDSHFEDFVSLINVESIMGVALQYIYDPEVLQFIGFITSPQMNELIYEFKNMAEFKEALEFLASRGYNLHDLLNDLYSARNLPSLDKSKMEPRNGVNGLIEDLIASLPLEDMKKLFEIKLETSPEVAELFDTINSEEFLEILRRMSHNPTFLELKATLQSYGFDFKYLCQLAITILGDYYQGVFCV